MVTRRLLTYSEHIGGMVTRLKWQKGKGYKMCHKEGALEHTVYYSESENTILSWKPMEW